MKSKKILIPIIALSLVVFLVGVTFGVSYFQSNKTLKQADSLVFMEKYEDAIALYEKILSEDFDIAISNKRDRAKELLESKEMYEEGLEYYEAEDFKEATKAFSKVSKNDSKRYSETSEKMKSIEELILTDANQYMQSGDFDVATDLLNDYLKVKSDSIDAKNLKEEIILQQDESAKQAKASDKKAADEAAEKKASSDAMLEAESEAYSLVGTYQTVVSKDANLRIAPKLDAEKIVALPQGTECYVYDTKIETSNRIWCQITAYYDDYSYEGWVSYNTMNYKCQ